MPSTGRGETHGTAGGAGAFRPRGSRWDTCSWTPFTKRVPTARWLTTTANSKARGAFCQTTPLILGETRSRGGVGPVERGGPRGDGPPPLRDRHDRHRKGTAFDVLHGRAFAVPAGRVRGRDRDDRDRRGPVRCVAQRPGPRGLCVLCEGRLGLSVDPGGLTDADVADVVFAAATRSFFTRVLDGLGAELDVQTAQAFAPDVLTSMTVGRPVAGGQAPAPGRGSPQSGAGSRGSKRHSSRHERASVAAATATPTSCWSPASIGWPVTSRCRRPSLLRSGRSTPTCTHLRLGTRAAGRPQRPDADGDPTGDGHLRAARPCPAGEAPRDGRDAKRAAGGKPSGSYPFGFARTGPDDREQHVLAFVRELRAQGRTLNEVAACLNNAPATTRATPLAGPDRPLAPSPAAEG